MKFYYTFGTSQSHPFFGGWVEIEAEDGKLADAAFRKEYPDKVPGMLNCACVYTEQEFETVGFREHGNMGRFCHRNMNAEDILKLPPVKEGDIPEFVGQVIDIFEDFLEGKGIVIDNPEKEESESPAIIYGEDYGNLSDELRGIFSAWGVIKKEGSVC